MGNLLCVHVYAANIHDTRSGVYTFEIFHNIKIDISPRIKNEFEVQPLRWVVERTLSWFGGSRRLSKDYEIKTFYQECICIISNLATILRRF